MRKPRNLWGILSVVCLALGAISVARVVGQVTHAAGESLAPHMGSAVLWFVVAWLLGRRGRRVEVPPSALAAAIQKKLGLPYKLLPDKVPPDALMRFYRRTRREEKGFTPLLVPADAALDQHLADLITQGGIPAPEAWLTTPQESGKEVLHRRWQAMFPNEADAEQPPASLMGEMTGGQEQVHFLSCLDGEAPKETLIFHLPTDAPWQAPAYIPVGGAHGIPKTEALLAVCRYWYETYGAAPAVIAYNSMEFMLPRPVDRAQAMEIAMEHFAFCPERVLVDTSSGTVGELADALWQSPLWYFRWDPAGETPQKRP